jgi:probable DNA metabolism protein
VFVYQCEDSLESIFTAIYNVYEEKRDIGEVFLSLEDELLLFASYIPVREDTHKVRKVIRSLKRRFGEEDYLHLCYALSSPSPDKAQAVFRTIAAGLAVGRGHLFDNLADDSVHLSYTLGKAARNELHHLLGFLRFQELEDGILFSKIGPKNNIVTFLMPHFADRLPRENFVIYDSGRKFFGVHPTGGSWYLLRDSDETVNQTEDVMKDRSLDGTKDKSMDGMKDRSLDGTKDKSMDGMKDRSLDGTKDKSMERMKDRSLDGAMHRTMDRSIDSPMDRGNDRSIAGVVNGIESRWSEDERVYQELFCSFCHRIAIKERENLKCQRSMLPLRFQEYMIEFHNNSQKHNLIV